MSILIEIKGFGEGQVMNIKFGLIKHHVTKKRFDISCWLYFHSLPINSLTLTWFFLRLCASRKHFVVASSLARPSTSQAHFRVCAFRGGLATLFSLHTGDDEASIVSLTADLSSTVRIHFVLTIYLIFLILHSLVLQPTWPAMDIALSPQFPCERQCVTLDKLPLVSPKRERYRRLYGMIMIRISGHGWPFSSTKLISIIFVFFSFPLTFCIGLEIDWLLVLVP